MDNTLGPKVLPSAPSAKTTVEGAMSASSARVRLYLGGALVLCLLSVVTVLGLTAIRPLADNTSAIATLLGLFTPMLGLLLAAALKENHDAVNSRLSELLELTAASSRAKGQLESNPDAAQKTLAAKDAKDAE